MDISHPGSSQITRTTFTYDSKGRNTVVKYHKADGTETLKTAYTCDDQGRVSTIRDHYAFTGSGNYLEKTYTYDDFGRVTSMAYRGGSGHDDIREAYVYTYDRNNNIKSERIVSDYDKDDSGTGRDITRMYTYDTAGRLTETRETDNSDGTAGTGITKQATGLQKQSPEARRVTATMTLISLQNAGRPGRPRHTATTATATRPRR